MRRYTRSTSPSQDLQKITHHRKIQERKQHNELATNPNTQKMVTRNYVTLAESLYKNDMIGTKHAEKEIYLDMPVCDQFALERMYKQVKEADFWDAEDRKKGILWLEKWLQIPKEKSYYQ